MAHWNDFLFCGCCCFFNCKNLMKNTLLFIFVFLSAILCSQGNTEKDVEVFEKHCIITGTLAQQSSSTSAIYYRTIISIKEDTVHSHYNFIVAKVNGKMFGVWLVSADKTKAMIFSCVIGNSGSLSITNNEYIAESNSGRVLFFIQKSDSVYIPTKLIRTVRNKEVNDIYLFKK